MDKEFYDQLEYVDKRFGEGPTKKAIETIMEYHEAPEEYAEQLITFSNVLKGGKYKLEGYIKAVQYVSYRQMNLSMVDSYRRTYPDRCFRNGKPKPKGTVDALSSIYDKTQLVQGILSQMQIPLHIMMVAERVKAANVLANLMMNASSERIQMESADKLLNHIKTPESVKIELDLGSKTDDTIKELNDKLESLANYAQGKIMNGTITPVEVLAQ